jgi:hypothetical protein
MLLPPLLRHANETFFTSVVLSSAAIGGKTIL